MKLDMTSSSFSYKPTFVKENLKYSLAGMVETADQRFFQIAVVAEDLSKNSRVAGLPEMIVDAILAYVQNHSGKNARQVLKNAIEYANMVAFEFFSKKRSSCSVAVALITSEPRLYIAHVGNSRIYLVRKNKLSQLTLDHTYANLLPVFPEIQNQNRSKVNGDEVILKVGQKNALPVDMGFHSPRKSSYHEYALAQNRGKIGLGVRPGDSILVCSHDLVRNNFESRRELLAPADVTRCLNASNSRDYAQNLVQLGVQQNQSLIPSAATIQISVDQNQGREGTGSTLLGSVLSRLGI